MPSNSERYVAAAAYIFNLGYALSSLVNKDSPFLKYHFEQENRIITRVLLPGLALFFLGILWETAASEMLIYLGVLVAIFSFILSAVGLVYALRGQTKKII